MTQFAEMIIGITAIVSLWVSIKSLKRTEQESAMSTVPTLIIEPFFEKLAIESVAKDVFSLTNEDYPIHIWFKFKIENVGRGIALEVSDPNLFDFNAVSYKNYKPIFLKVGDGFEFLARTTKYFSECQAMYTNGKRLIVGFELSYKNDQKNILCTSSITIEAQPFIFKDNQLRRAIGAEIISIKNFDVKYKMISN